MAAPTKPQPLEILLPKARLINHNLFERDAYTDPATGKEGKLMYKIEMAFDPDTPELAKIIDQLYGAVCDHFDLPTSPEPFLDIDKRHDTRAIITPFLDGDQKAAEREEKGKEGAAYKGKYVVRANTGFNKFGQDAPGGAAVFDMDVSEVGIANADKVYPGCYVQAAVAVNFYQNATTKQRAFGFYLKAVQKVAEGERLVMARDMSKMFQPVGRTEAPAEGTRRRRPG